jgi:CheY-like chemotaxis protein
MRTTTILIVDDNRAVLGVTKSVLESEGYQVYAAESAKSAIAVAQRLQCGLDLLLTDIVMPEMDGHNLIAIIRRLCPNVSTIAMSGFAPGNPAERDYFVLAKPFTRDQLLAAVNKILNPQGFAGGS